MNRVHQPYWARIREVLNGWFDAYPVEHANDLRARFRDAAPDQHFAAWWELYLFHLFRCLGFEVEIHPELDGTSGRPDFRLRRDGKSILVEAATTFSGIVDEDRNGPREGWIKDAVNTVESPNFFVGLEFERVGLERPSVGEIAKPLQAWLDSLDPDEITKLGLLNAPELVVSVRDWVLRFTPIPIKPEARGNPRHPVLGLGPSIAGSVNDVEMIGRTLDRKRRKYGTPDEPLVLALLLMSSFMENHDVEQALFGTMALQFEIGAPESERWVRQRDGFWLRENGPRATRISGVLTGTNLLPWTVGRVWPRFWPNPWASRPVVLDLELPLGIGDESGVVRHEELDGAPHRILSLPPDWPGPEAPFEDLGSA